MRQVVLAPLNLPGRHAPLTFVVLLFDKSISTSGVVKAVDVEFCLKTVGVDGQVEFAQGACLSGTWHNYILFASFELDTH